MDLSNSKAPIIISIDPLESAWTPHVVALQNFDELVNIINVLDEDIKYPESREEMTRIKSMFPQKLVFFASSEELVISSPIVIKGTGPMGWNFNTITFKPGGTVTSEADLYIYCNTVVEPNIVTTKELRIMSNYL